MDRVPEPTEDMRVSRSELASGSKGFGRRFAEGTHAGAAELKPSHLAGGW